jgi:mannose/cellobiose epimerase-like protein (N-acyl-D-glucosamine 2-epimerase family)
MEELLELRTLLMGGHISEALLLVEEMTEMSKDDKINKISSYAKVLLLHLIKRSAEQRSTRSWELSIKNAVNEIQKTNRRRKAGGTYLDQGDLLDALRDMYNISLELAAAEAFGGHYESVELGAMVDREGIIQEAITLILKNEAESSHSL